MKTTKRPLDMVGWRELVDFTDLGIVGVTAKIDTGAQTSALHAIRLHHFELDDRPWVRFTVPARRRRPTSRVEAPLIGVRKIRSSNGEMQKRFVIRTRLRIGQRSFRAEVTLTNRSQMGFAMLVGRSALARRFVVDAAKSFVQGRDRREEPS